MDTVVEILGEAIKAFVVFRPGTTAKTSELELFLKRRLPPFKLPSSIEVRDDLPKNESGKIMKQDLRAESGS